MKTGGSASEEFKTQLRKKRVTMESIFRVRAASWVVSSKLLRTGMTAADTWHSCTDRVDRIRVMMIGGKAEARFWDR